LGSSTALEGRQVPVLRDRVAVVTGSTSGIGMGIARALAEAGCAVMLNGFGDREVIERQRAELAETYDVKVHYNGGDLEQPEACAELIDPRGRDTYDYSSILANESWKTQLELRATAYTVRVILCAEALILEWSTNGWLDEAGFGIDEAWDECEEAVL